MFRRRAASKIRSRASRFAAREPTSRTCKRWSSQAGQHTTYGEVEIRAYKPARNIFGCLRRLQKTCSDFSFGEAVLWAFQNLTYPWPPSILFGHFGLMSPKSDLSHGSTQGECQRTGLAFKPARSNGINKLRAGLALDYCH